ncbi:helix-turn-helix domain-containing protein [Agromyces soli]
MAVDADALSRVLGSVDLRLGIARREALRPGALIAVPSGKATLLYFVTGSVRGRARLSSGCRVDIDGDAQRVQCDVVGEHTRLVAGDAFLTLGGAGFALEALDDVDLVVVELELSDDASRLASVMPAFVTVADFAALDPAAAALAGNMGSSESAPCAKGGADLLVCRMMAKTVLLAVIRAWAMTGRAPHGWPALSADPFLDRVIAAIHDAPGHDWTVERLASVGAMSRSTFAERFRNALGRSPVDYVTEVRIDAAKRMLDAGSTISYVSRELGYGSDEGFSRAFRRRTGVTPSAWRMTGRPAARDTDRAARVAVPA